MNGFYAKGDRMKIEINAVTLESLRIRYESLKTYCTLNPTYQGRFDILKILFEKLIIEPQSSKEETL